MSADIDQGECRFSVSDQIHRFIAEGREGREPSKDADNQKRSRLGPDERADVSKLRQESDEETPKYIYDLGAVGKRNTLAECLRCATHQIAKDGSNESPGPDE